MFSIQKFIPFLPFTTWFFGYESFFGGKTFQSKEYLSDSSDEHQGDISISTMHIMKMCFLYLFFIIVPSNQKDFKNALVQLGLSIPLYNIFIFLEVTYTILDSREE